MKTLALFLLTLFLSTFVSTVFAQNLDNRSANNSTAADRSSAAGDLPKSVQLEDERPANQVQFNYTYESLTKNFGAWRNASLDVSHRFDSRQMLYGAVRETERVGQRDREAMIGFYQPLGKRWAVLAETNASPTHNVLPKWSALIQVERSFAAGWNVQTGYRRTNFNTARVNLGTIGAEKYWGNYRAAYTLYVNNLEKAGTSAAHRLQFNRYYGEQTSTIGISLAAGRELESLGAARGGVLRTDVQSVAISGYHWFGRNWGTNYVLTLHRQGSLYWRRGLTLGLRYQF